MIARDDAAERQKLVAYLAALRPKTLTASVAPALVGTGLCRLTGGMLSPTFLLLHTLPAFLLVQIGTNLVNDACDYEHGADTEARKGPRRLTQSGLVTPSIVRRAGLACFALALVLMVPVFYARGWMLAATLVVSCAAGYLYTGGPYPLAYHALGDVTVVLFFGVVCVSVVRHVHDGAFMYNIPSLLAGLQVGLLAANLLVINNLRDSETDRACGKNTLVVVLGQRRGKLEVALFAGAAYALGSAWWAAYGLRGTYAAAAPLLTLPLAASLVRDVLRTPTEAPLAPGYVYNSLLARAAAVHLLFSACLGGGMYAGSPRLAS